MRVAVTRSPFFLLFCAHTQAAEKPGQESARQSERRPKLTPQRDLARRIERVQEIYRNTIFPEMKTKWSAYP
jgi:hypothetical protein